jgi:hypothetical protein
MLGPHVDVHTLVPRNRILHLHSSAYELALTAPTGELVLVVENDGSGGGNRYSDDRVARVLSNQARADFATVVPLDSLCAALADGADTYEEALAAFERFLEADAVLHETDFEPYDVAPPQAADDPRETQILVLGFGAFGLPFSLLDADRCVLALPNGSEVVATVAAGGQIVAAWDGGHALGDLESVSHAVHAHAEWLARGE